MIARLLTQRACLEAAARMIATLSGPVLEIGLGKGRTYSHLRLLFPDRAIFAFDKEVHAPPDSQPDGDHLIVGDFRETLPGDPARFGGPAALAHADIGSERPERDAELAAFVGPAAAALLAPGGLLLSDREMAADGLAAVDAPPVDLPAGVDPWPYFLYRRTAP